MIRYFVFIAAWIAVANGAVAQKVIRSTEIFSNRKLIERTTNDTKGNAITRETLLSEDPDVWFKESMIYASGRLVSSSHYMNGSNIADYEYFYNELGQVERRRQKQNDSVTGVSYYEYNEKGLLSLETNYLGKNKKVTRSFEYNASGLLTLRTENIAEDDEYMSLTEGYSYDKRNKLESVVAMNGSDTLSDIRFLYTPLGQKMQQDVLYHNDTTLTIVWEYKKGKDYPYIEKHKSDGYVVRMTKFFRTKSGLMRKEKTTEYRVYSGKMKPEKIRKKYKYHYFNESAGK